ncbi:MAG: hypothetical protein GKS06_20150 [Acidobacteria bacterium]|nr:hypothetical protein [Acidobacteriota bacterium]
MRRVPSGRGRSCHGSTIMRAALPSLLMVGSTIGCTNATNDSAPGAWVGVDRGIRRHNDRY